MITKYKTYNESLKDKLKGKSEEEILQTLDKLSDSDKIVSIITNKFSYDLLPDDLIVVGDLWCDYKDITSLPDNLTVKYNLFCTDNKLTELPNNLKVGSDLYVQSNKLTSLPEDLIVGGNLYCSNNSTLPNNTKKPIGVKGSFYF